MVFSKENCTKNCGCRDLNRKCSECETCEIFRKDMLDIQNDEIYEYLYR